MNGIHDGWVDFDPDYEEYLKKIAWTDEEAAALLSGIDPDKLKQRIKKLENNISGLSGEDINPDHVDWIIERDEERDLLLSIIKQAKGINKLKPGAGKHEYSTPTDICRWAVQSGIKLPEKLQAIVNLKAPAAPDTNTAKKKNAKDAVLHHMVNYLKNKPKDIVSKVLDDLDVKNAITEYEKLAPLPLKDKTKTDWVTVARNQAGVTGPKGRPPKKKE